MYNMTTQKLKYIGVLIIVCIGFFSCGYSEKDAQKYLPGVYTYEIPSGEIQVLRVNPDFTYQQVIYSKNKKDTLYKNEGKMYVQNNEIKLEHWLECYELAEQKILSNPYLANSSSGVYWRRLKESGDVLIIMFDQSNYIFKKRKDVPN